MGGNVELRKQIAVVLATSTGAGAQVVGDAAMIFRCPSVKIRWSWEIAPEPGNLLGLDNLSTWFMIPLAATNPPAACQPIGNGTLPDTFEANSSGRIFRIQCHFSPVKRNPTVTGSGNGRVIALVTFEPVDVQMTDFERSMWFGACSAAIDGPVAQIQAA